MNADLMSPPGAWFAPEEGVADKFLENAEVGAGFFSALWIDPDDSRFCGMWREFGFREKGWRFGRAADQGHVGFLHLLIAKIVGESQEGRFGLGEKKHTAGL